MTRSRHGFVTPESGGASFADDVRFWTRRQPSAPAVTVVADGVVDTAWTWADLDRWSNRVAYGLLERGAAPRTRVVHLGRNRASYVALLYGASKARVTLIGLNWRLTAEELAPLLADAGPVVAMVDDEFRPAFDDALAASGVELSVVRGDDPAPWSAYDDGDRGLEPAPDDIALAFYTSGTTGVPKCALLPVRAIRAGVSRPVPWAMRPGSTTLVCSPVFHTAGTGWIYLPLHSGGSCLLLRDPSPGEILDAISTFRATHALLVPAVIAAVLAAGGIADLDTPSLETLVYGASPIAPPLLRRAIQTFDCDIVQAYGMTETGGPITYLMPDDHDPSDPHGRLRSAGTPPPGVDIKVVDPKTGEERRTGERGEVWARSDQQMVAYLNRPDATTDTVTVDGWLRTGDAGYLDGDGYLYLTDRLSDVIVSGAENVYPVEVENTLTAHPGVDAAAVIGIPHERWGETVCAVVVPVAGDSVDEARLITWCRERLAHYKAPTRIVLAEDLPRNAAGKVLRRVLRAPFWEGSGRTIG